MKNETKICFDMDDIQIIRDNIRLVIESLVEPDQKSRQAGLRACYDVLSIISERQVEPCI